MLKTHLLLICCSTIGHTFIHHQTVHHVTFETKKELTLEYVRQYDFDFNFTTTATIRYYTPPRRRVYVNLFTKQLMCPPSKHFKYGNSFIN